MAIDTDKIRRLREKLDLTYQQAAERAGMKSRQRWYNIEAGVSTNPGIETLEAIAAVLGVKAKDLLK